MKFWLDLLAEGRSHLPGWSLLSTVPAKHSRQASSCPDASAGLSSFFPWPANSKMQTTAQYCQVVLTALTGTSSEWRMARSHAFRSEERCRLDPEACNTPATRLTSPSTDINHEADSE